MCQNLCCTEEESGACNNNLFDDQTSHAVTNEHYRGLTPMRLSGSSPVAELAWDNEPLYSLRWETC